MELNPISCEIRCRRIAAGLTLEQLARRAGTSATALSRYENGWTRFEVSTLNNIATALGCRMQVRFLGSSRALRPVNRIAATRQLARLFWDKPLQAGDFAAYPRWIVERVLEYGAMEDVRVLMAVMGRRPFLEQVARARLQARTANLWHNILEREGIPCTQKYCRKAAQSCWPGWNGHAHRS